MAEPYGGAVKKCPMCDSLGYEWHIRRGGTWPDCDAGWVPVDIMEYCTPPVAASWAYPQPGDIVLTEDGIFGVVQYVDCHSRAFVREGRYGRVSKMRLVVDQPNEAGRIPGTQPPGANDD